MNTFKRKSLYAALAGVSALGVTGAAQAVNLNPDGLGQVLIYPYYTTRADAGGNAYTSLLSVVNTTSSAKAVKVRFLEGKNSREVLDFNLFLSKHDVWTAAILPSSTSVQGGIFGGMTLINVNAGTDFTEDAVALDNYVQFGGNIYNPAGSIQPDLQQAFPPVSQVLANSSVYTSSWTFGTADPVSAVLMHSNVMNEFVLDAGTKSGTDWVVTFPTKRYYVNVGTGNAPKLFQRNFNQTDGSCDDVSLAIYDREERTTSTPVGFSPPPPTQTNSICWEANVVTFNNSNVLGSVNIANVPTTFQNGWLNMGFPTAIAGASPTVHELINTTNTLITDIGSSTSSGQTVTYIGLPVVGFAVQTFSNGTLSVGGVNVLSNYGGNFIHKYQTIVD